MKYDRYWERSVHLLRAEACRGDLCLRECGISVLSHHVSRTFESLIAIFLLPKAAGPITSMGKMLPVSNTESARILKARERFRYLTQNVNHFSNP